MDPKQFGKKADAFFADSEKLYTDLERMLNECIESGNRAALFLHIARIAKTLECAANLQGRLDRETGNA
jgi:hypothetical protein